MKTFNIWGGRWVYINFYTFNFKLFSFYNIENLSLYKNIDYYFFRKYKRSLNYNNYINNDYYKNYFYKLQRINYLLHNKNNSYKQKYKFINLYKTYSISNNSKCINEYIYHRNINRNLSINSNINTNTKYAYDYNNINHLYFKSNSLKNFKYNRYFKNDYFKKGIYYDKYPLKKSYFERFYNNKSYLHNFNYLFYNDNVIDNKITLINTELISLKNEYLKKMIENNVFKHKKLNFKDIYKYFKRDINIYNDDLKNRNINYNKLNNNNITQNNIFQDSYFITKNLDYEFIFDKIKNMIFEELIFMCNIK